MDTKLNQLATDFGKLICTDLKIIDATEYLKREAIDALQGEYGDEDDGFGTEEYSSLHIYSHDKFDRWFDKNLSDSQKNKLLELSEDGSYFEASISSHSRKNLVIELLFKLKRTEANEYTHLNVSIDFKNINKDTYTIHAEMYGQLSDDEISKMKMIYELKR